jgi:flagellar assembly protein FliH
MSSSNPKSSPKNIPPPEGGKQQSTYGRFIPREELNSFSAWAPENIGGSNSGQGVSRQAHKPEAPAKTTSPSEELAHAVKAARQEGYRDGHRDGTVALERFKQEYSAQVSAQLSSLLESLSAQMEDLQQDMARALALSATHLARQAVRSELQTRPELVARVASEALESLLLSARHITLRVHPEDFILVSQGAAEMLSARGARVISDPSMTRGGCMVESDIGLIDGSIESRWRRALASIGCNGEWDETLTAHAESKYADLGDLDDAPEGST